MTFIVVLNLIKGFQEIKRQKLRKMLRKCQSKFQHFLKEIEAQETGFVMNKTCIK